MADVDTLNLEEQNLLLWIAETEIGVAEPLAISLADFPSDRVNAGVDRLVQYGFLSREFPWLDRDRPSRYGLSASLTGRGAQVVVELWRRRLRELPKERLTA